MLSSLLPATFVSDFGKDREARPFSGTREDREDPRGERITLSVVPLKDQENGAGMRCGGMGTLCLGSYK